MVTAAGFDPAIVGSTPTTPAILKKVLVTDGKTRSYYVKKKTRALKEMFDILSETENEETTTKFQKIVSKIDPKIRKDAEAKFEGKLDAAKSATSDEDMKNLLKQSDDFPDLPDDAKFYIQDAMLYIYVYLRKLGHGRIFSFIFANTFSVQCVLQFLADGEVTKEDIRKSLKSITSNPVTHYIKYLFLNLFISFGLNLAAYATRGLSALWTFYLGIKYLVKFIRMDVQTFQLEPIDNNFSPAPAAKIEAVRETIEKMYNKYKRLNLVS